MKKTEFFYFFMCLLYSLITCRDRPFRSRNVDSDDQSIYDFTQKQYLFDQIVDHSNYQKTAYFNQRYWVVDDYFDSKNGPVFMYLYGQAACQGIDQKRKWILTLAQKTKGLILILEHRFYGESLPFGSFSFKIENMRILTTTQALSDIANFIESVKSSNLHNVGQNPWIIVGGSYAGALSAWFRYKYPHLVIGSVASSGVVQAI